MLMKVHFEIEAGQAGHLTLDANVFWVAVDALLKKIKSASVFLVAFQIVR
jgi:hypothetical protein